MAFFIVERVTDDGGLRLPVSDTFVTREEALASLSAAVASGDATVTGGQVYVADLETAIPVLVMPVAERVAAGSRPEGAQADAAGSMTPAMVEGPEIETPEAEFEAEADILTVQDEAETDSLALEEVADAELPSDEDAFATEEGASLADALKRATSSLEESGIRAPESIGAHEDDEQESQGPPAQEDEGVGVEERADERDESEMAAQAYIAPELRDLPVATTVAEPMSSAIEADEAPLAPTSVGGSEGGEEPASPESPSEWPWANVEAYVPEEEEASDFEVQPAPEDGDTLIASAPPMGEDAYLPKPVILGDYGDTGSDDVSAAFEEPPAAVEGEDEDDVSSLEPGYEASGSLDMSAYTCSDCVYSNTCPKVGEVTPAECGTFQWRSS
jgi:hypothetical protein